MVKRKPGSSGAKKGDKLRSWLPGQKGQGAEGMSKGYGGSGGKGTGASGPDDETSPNRKRPSPSLPSRKTINEVLR